METSLVMQIKISVNWENAKTVQISFSRSAPIKRRPLY